MKTIASIVLVCVLGCSSKKDTLPASVQRLPDTTGALTKAERDLAQDVPASATTQFDIDGIDQPLFGVFQLRVGPGEEKEYDFVGTSADRRSRLEGQLDVARYDDPARDDLTRGVVFESGGLFRDYVGDDPLTWTLSDGEKASHYLGRAAKVRIDPDGLLTATLSAIDVSRIDGAAKAILPGRDQTITIHGRATGACLEWMGGAPNDKNGNFNPVLHDVRRQADACKRLLSAW